MSLIPKILVALASIRLTIVLLSLAMILLFVGTLAQARLGVWQVVDQYFRSHIAWVDPGILIPPQIVSVGGSFPFPGGMLIGGLLVLNLIAAHVVRFSLSGRRLGVLILHAGLIVLLAGEFVTARYAHEGMMSIDVGSSSRYIEDLRTTELVLIDPSDPDTDRVFSIPEAVLLAHRADQAIKDDRLPFQIRIDRWLDNSRLVRAEPANPSLRGVATEAAAVQMPPVRGVDGAQTDAPAAEVTLIHEGREIGTWLLWVNLIDAQEVTLTNADEKLESWGIALRYARTYKPYEIHLLEFRHDRFVGTQIARNFSSRIRIIDPDRNVDREVVISMNNPLRYQGATFYQHSFQPDETGTILQVVQNPGSILPYIACVLVGAGMTWHFILGLMTFFRRRSSRAARTSASGLIDHNANPDRPPALQAALPWIAAMLGILLAFHQLVRPVPASDYDLETFARLPVSAGGRVKPMDTVARHVVLAAGGKQKLHLADGRRLEPIEFLLRLIADPQTIQDVALIRVDHSDVLNLLGLQPHEVGRVSLATVEPHWEAIARQALPVLDIVPKQRDPYQRAILSLFDRVSLVLAHSQMQSPYVVAPFAEGSEWQSLPDAILQHAHFGSGISAAPHPSVHYYDRIMSAFMSGRPSEFYAAVGEFYRLFQTEMPRITRKAHHEVLFNRASLFTNAIAVYVGALLLALLSIFLRSRSQPEPGKRDGVADGLRSTALGLLIGAAIVHTLAIGFRIYLQERPPVTNLYSSAVFVGWAAVLIGILLERLFPVGLALIGSATVGVCTLIIAHHLGSDGDTMQMMQAVLDSNFWLATHVIVIILGYSATFLAGALGVFYILAGVFSRRLTSDRARALSRMVYGVVCFALLTSFLGTVLGGIWADQSWGRFWGWDPKENGAAMVVLITAIILHARWAGLAGPRGIMLLAVCGNIITAWSWFGTNLLGVGLHAYGFMESGVFWMGLFVVSQLLVISIGLIPIAAWKSSPHLLPSASARANHDPRRP